jgi:PAS domain S-box-containing protein
VITGVIQDIHERIEAEQATERLLADREAMIQRMRLYIDNMPTACLHNDSDFRIIEWNPAAERLFGFTRDEAVGKHPSELIVPPERHGVIRAIRDRLESGERNVYVLGENIAKDGHTISCEWISSPMFSNGEYVGSISMCMDVSDREQLKNQLLRVQRMESIGRVAGGIAHDFNNILTAIMGFTDFASARLPHDNPAQADLDQVRRSADRAAELTSQLLAFARKQPREPRAVDPNEIVLGMEPMLRRVLGAEVELRVFPASDVWRMHADPNQIDQVILNLAINARDAMPEGGVLTVETANVTLDDDYASRNTGVEPGDYVSLTVTDNGVGMSVETQAMVFEPFYTTKEPGKGTGLGLATCYGIVKQSGGHIWVYSEPGQGATFKVYLPRASGPLAERSTPDTQLKMHVGTETILLVEDDEAVRMYATSVLESLGYNVLTAESGHDALEVAESFEETIHLLLTDVVMPKMRGTKLAEALWRTRPNLKVVYASGYPGHALKQHEPLTDVSDFLQKPYSSSALAAIVRETIDAKSKKRG